MITGLASRRRLLDLAPVYSHVWHAFYLNCRKMFEFFTYSEHERYVRAVDFLGSEPLPYRFRYWTQQVQRHMEGHLLHVGGDRIAGQVSWTGANDSLYLPVRSIRQRPNTKPPS